MHHALMFQHAQGLFLILCKKKQKKNNQQLIMCRFLGNKDLNLQTDIMYCYLGSPTCEPLEPLMQKIYIYIIIFLFSCF